MPSADRLPPPHPVFAAHFTDAIYDTDLAGNDDQLPFGTDEGFDTVWDWAHRAGELRSDPRLDYVLGTDASELAAQAQNDDEAAGCLIAAGFTLLRYTGAIGPADLRILVEVIRRQAARQPGSGFDIMERDLARFAALSSPASTSQSRRRTEPWLAFDAGWNDPSHAQWLQRIGDAIMADPAWIAWWSTSSCERLVLAPRPAGPPQGFLRVTMIGNTVELVASSAELSQQILGLAAGWEPADGIGVHEWTPDAADLFRAPILRMLRVAADQLGLPLPPDLPPSEPST